MDVREKLVELSDIQVLQREMECVKRKSATNCTDCLNCDLLMTDERILTAYKNAIDALQNAHGVTVQEWISVKDRLPEKPMKCLVYTKRGEYGGYEITYYNEGFYLQYANVTHWMPLPDEPEVKND